MANLQVKDGAAATKYMKGSGAGTDLDPHIIEHLETNSAAIKTAVETIDNAISGNEMQVDVVTSALPTGASTAANQSTANTSLANLETKIGEVQASPTANTVLDRLKAIATALAGTLTVSGAVTASAGTNLNTSALLTEADFDGKAGSLTETAPATDTASSGLNGRLQRIAQRLTSLIALVPAALTGSGNFKVAVQEALPAGENHLGEVGGNMARVSVELTRPANTTAYTANDVVADSTTAATLLTLSNAVRVNAGSGYIVRVSVTTDKKSITPRFRVHFFNANNPTFANDNVAYKELYADAGKRLGYVDLPAMSTAVDTTNSDMSRAFDSNVRLPIVAAASTRHIYALLETLDGFTPASGEKFTLTVFVDCN